MGEGVELQACGYVENSDLTLKMYNHSLGGGGELTSFGWKLGPLGGSFLCLPLPSTVP